LPALAARAHELLLELTPEDLTKVWRNGLEVAGENLGKGSFYVFFFGGDFMIFSEHLRCFYDIFIEIVGDFMIFSGHVW